MVTILRMQLCIGPRYAAGATAFERASLHTLDHLFVDQTALLLYGICAAAQLRRDNNRCGVSLASAVWRAPNVGHALPSRRWDRGAVGVQWRSILGLPWQTSFSHAGADIIQARSKTANALPWLLPRIRSPAIARVACFARAMPQNFYSIPVRLAASLSPGSTTRELPWRC